MPQPSLHLLLCFIAVLVGVLVYANVFHVATVHAAAGIIIVTVGVLLAL